MQINTIRPKAYKSNGCNEEKPEKDHVEEKLEVQYCQQLRFCHAEYAEETKESHRLFQPAR
jgi:hypothetical protein